MPAWITPCCGVGPLVAQIQRLGNRSVGRVGWSNSLATEHVASTWPVGAAPIHVPGPDRSRTRSESAMSVDRAGRL